MPQRALPLRDLPRPRAAGRGDSSSSGSSWLDCPTTCSPGLCIALELVKRNDFAGAAPYALDAATLEPRNFLTRKVAGQVKLQTGDAKGAIVELEAARTLEPTSPSVRYQLARAYQRAGRAEDAKRERAEFSRLEAIQQKKRGGAAAREDETQ